MPVKNHSESIIEPIPQGENLPKEEVQKESIYICGRCSKIFDTSLIVFSHKCYKCKSECENQIKKLILHEKTQHSGFCAQEILT